MALLDIPFDCLLSHLDDVSIRKLWSTCHQMKVDIETFGKFCRYRRCMKFLPKGTDMEGYCKPHYEGHRARIFFRGHEDLFCQKRKGESFEKCRIRMGKYYPKIYSMELEPKLGDVMKILEQGRLYQLCPDVYLTLTKGKIYMRSSKFLYKYFIVCEREHILPVEYSRQMLMMILVKRDKLSLHPF